LPDLIAIAHRYRALTLPHVVGATATLQVQVPLALTMPSPGTIGSGEKPPHVRLIGPPCRGCGTSRKREHGVDVPNDIIVTVSILNVPPWQGEYAMLTPSLALPTVKYGLVSSPIHVMVIPASHSNFQTDPPNAMGALVTTT
jgi:hypothetical protein